MHTISEIMTKNVDALNPNADLVEVAQNMKKQDVGILPISDGKRVQGIVTKSDVVLRALAKNKDPRTTRASDVMTRDVDYCFEDQSIEDAAETMQKKAVNHLLVLDRQKNLVGIVSLDDLTNWTSKTGLFTGRAFEERLRPVLRVRSNFKGLRRMNTGASVGVISAALLTVGFFIARRRMGAPKIFKESPLSREMKAA